MCPLHARKYAKCNHLDWTPTRENFVPPEEDVTNENLEEFIVQCWEDGSKPNVTQGRRYINHILASHGRPNLNKYHRSDYGPVLDVLKGLEQEKKWIDHQSKGAEPLTREAVKKILKAEIHDENGMVILKKLRNKALATTLILCGWHPSDARRVWESNVINLDDFHDRDGKHRPKFLFNDLRHNKRPMIKVHNTVGCGCKRAHHPKNAACPYNTLQWYQDLVDQCDERLIDRKNRLSRPERLRHFDENGNLQQRHFFRSMTKKGCNPHVA